MATHDTNRALREGAFEKVMEPLLKRLKPEAAYFTGMNGARTATIVFEMHDEADLVEVCEPLFQHFNAKIEITPAMSLDDVKAGLAKWMASGAGEEAAAPLH